MRVPIARPVRDRAVGIASPDDRRTVDAFPLTLPPASRGRATSAGEEGPRGETPLMITRSRLARALAVLTLVFALGACTVEDVIRVAFAERGATPAQQEQAIRVAHCESTLRPEAISSGGGNWGLFQINRVHRGRVEAMGLSWDSMLRPYENAYVAADIWAEQGWRPWSCARRLGIR